MTHNPNLTDEQKNVLHHHGTEPAFSGKYHDHHEDGIYRCADCGTTLFDSAHKFDSGTGWPSFDRVLDDLNVEEQDDSSFFMRRTEVHCAVCQGHLGHVFPDGPRDTTGMRYCINSASLDFSPRKEGESTDEM